MPPRRPQRDAVSLSYRLTELEGLSAAELRSRLQEAFSRRPPKHMSRDLLLRAQAYHLQEQAEGGLSKAALKRLAYLARSGTDQPPPLAGLRLKPGTCLVREWRGEVHHVTVLDDGFDYRGVRYGSLSQIARIVTGTRWSGPLFFGLRKRAARGEEAAHEG